MSSQEDTPSRSIQVLDTPPQLPAGFLYACRTGKRRTPPKSKEPKAKKPKAKKKAPAQPKPKAFRFGAKLLFATFPQCPTDKQVALDNLLTAWRTEIAYAVVAHEKHKDEGDHLHVLVKFLSQKEARTPTFADFIAGEGYHANVQAARSEKNTLNYVMKDGDFVTYGTPPVINGKKESKFDAIALAIQRGATAAELQRDYPGIYMMQETKITRFFTIVEEGKLLKSKNEWHGVVVPDVLKDPIAYQVANWLNDNIKKPRKFKQAQLWFCGPPNIGKTSLVNNLDKYLRIYTVCLEEDFMDGFNYEKYDLVVIDEFRGQKTITWLNQFVQGGTMPMKIKGSRGIKVAEKGNLPVLVLSNYSIKQCYHKADDMAVATVQARFEEAYVIDENYHLDLDFVHLEPAEEDEKIIELSDEESTDYEDY